MLVVKLIRHGESEFNRAGIIQGHTNSPLSETGRRQAHATGRWLLEEGICAIYTSPLKRAFETASIIGEHLGLVPVKVDELKEIGLGVWEGRAIEDVRREDPKNLRLWFTQPTRAKIPGAEPLEAFQKRVVEALHRIASAHPEGQVALVTHGGVISAILAYVLGLSMNNIWRIRLDNASVSEVVWGHPLPKVSLVNSTFHLKGIEAKGVSIWNMRSD